MAEAMTASTGTALLPFPATMPGRVLAARKKTALGLDVRRLNARPSRASGRCLIGRRCRTRRALAEREVPPHFLDPKSGPITRSPARLKQDYRVVPARLRVAPRLLVPRLSHQYAGDLRARWRSWGQVHVRSRGRRPYRRRNERAFDSRSAAPDLECPKNWTQVSADHQACGRPRFDDVHDLVTPGKLDRIGRVTVILMPKSSSSSGCFRPA
jgi:hypothetical protein